jgi:hypothetical protein
MTSKIEILRKTHEGLDLVVSIINKKLESYNSMAVLTSKDVTEAAMFAHTLQQINMLVGTNIPPKKGQNG